jgi:hypothetical protein
MRIMLQGAVVLALGTLALAGAPGRARAQARDGREEAPRVSAERQQQLIQLQHARTREYSARLLRQQQLAEQRAVLLERQNRMAHYRFQKDYSARLRQQQAELANSSTHDYDNDPYFYTAPTYRYTRAGRTYQTNRYGADLLRQSIQRGHQEGVEAGRADRRDRHRRSYQNAYAYQDANVGYNGMYLDQAEYNYYFRRGFQRGYQEGFDEVSRFGTNEGGGVSAEFLSAILNLRTLQ